MPLFGTRHPYKDKKVLITGGSRGLGLAIAKELIDQGASVALLARDEVELEGAKQILTDIQGDAHVDTYKCDVTMKTQVDDCLAVILAKWGHLDVVVNNAGSILVGPFDSMNEDDFRAQMELHLFAVIHMVKQVLPHFRERGQGAFINICSLGGRVAVPHMLPYDASKFALSGFSQGLAAELGKEKIQVTTVYPALMKTGSPIQAVFKGDQEKEFDWFATADYFPGVTLPAQTAAKKILHAAHKGRAEIVLSRFAQLRLLGAVLAPELMHWTMSTINKFLPDDPSDSYKTGAQSESKSSVFYKYFSHMARKTEAELNQKRKTNPKFNLGLAKPARKTAGKTGTRPQQVH